MKRKRMLRSAAEEIRWALVYSDRLTNFCALCRKYYFHSAAFPASKIKTYPTRERAREALRNHANVASIKVIKVRVTVTPIVE